MSGRPLFAPNYNPPCNVYQPDASVGVRKVMTGSLAPPSVAPIDRNTFGLAKRFTIEEDLLIPGPGAYTKTKSKSVSNVLIPKRTYSKIRVLDSKPSIPYTYYGQNKNDLEEQAYKQYLLMQEDVIRSHKNVEKSQPVFSFSKCPRIDPQAKK